MTNHNPLPPILRELFPADLTTGRTLSVVLPPGRTVLPDDGEGPVPVMWMSDGPAAAGLWSELVASHHSSGLWPLLLEAHRLGMEEFRPWGSGELFPDMMSQPEEHDPQELLAGWWEGCAGVDEGLAAFVDRQTARRTGGDVSAADADSRARAYAAELLQRRPRLRIGLVPADRGADALTASGWSGPVNSVSDTAEISAVLRYWEDRFGVRVVALGFADLYVSVAAPPTTLSEAMQVAAEHFAFCPDNVGSIEELPEYAEQLVNADSWHFWWD
ncbi:DUF4253 domain-containing protein [Kitasatospora sp. NPDC057936]|uniref:DUF4253 domain-containing protein n=1 Tax=Kitasatospora sp. NPDC057936 TaxID=3346283 RepID=UPI0036D82667